MHPAIRPYRGHIYEELQRRFRTRFLALGFPAINARWARHFRLENLQILPDRSFLAYRTGVSWSLIQRALAEDYDIWIASTLYAFATHAAFPVVKSRRRLFVLWTEDWYWGGDWASIAIKPYCRWLLSHVDLAIAAGTKQAAFLASQGVSGERIAVAFNSCFPLPSRTITEPNQSASVYNRSRFRVLYLGRMLDYKGPDCLLRAYAHLEALAPDRTELFFCGQGAAEASCRRLAEALGLRNVRFFGRVEPDQAGEFYRNADVFVHPCRWRPKARVKGEAWGFVINEAMACGLPVITTTAVAAERDLITEGISGFVVPPDNVEQIAERLVQLYECPELRRRMGVAAQQAIERQFQPSAQAAAFCDAIQTLTERHRR